MDAVTRAVRGCIRALRERGVVRVDVFGSVARGTAQAQSDVDFLVYFGATPSLRDLVEVRRALADAVGRDVDVITPGALLGAPRLRERVLGEAVRVA